MNDIPKDAAPIASPARQRLASLTAARDEISAAIDRATAALDRLISAQACQVPVVAELARLDTAESAAMAAWARRGREGDDAPTPDVAAREELNRKLTDARAKAESARRAEGGLRDEVARESVKLAPIGLAINEALAEVVAEEAGDLIAGFLESQRATAAKADQILAARDLIGDMARSAPEGEPARPLYIVLETLNQKLEKTFARSVRADVAAANRAAWASLVGRLQSDASARLDA